MIALLLMLGQVVAPPVVPPPTTTTTTTTAPVVAPLPPQDWSVLPVLRVRRAATETPDVSAFVKGEVAAGRCASAVRDARGWSIKVDLVLLSTAEGHVRRVTPRAIDCPTVEQYAAGLLLGTARDNVDTRGAIADTWFRTSMIFAWTG